jgi:two-component system LytT family response regulator
MTDFMKYTALIIDDEPPARNIIREFLKGNPKVDIGGEFSDGFSALKGIQELNPDLLFLDIQMPKLTGFELLELIDNPPVIVFSTAFDQYAIKAFEHNAVDYLLKPYSRERFEQALGKALEILASGTRSVKSVRNILQTMDEKPEYMNRIAVKIRHKVYVIPVGDIHYIQADGDYVTIHSKNEKFLKEKTMQYFESHLDPARFVRIHRSAIINVDYIDKIEYYDRESHAVLLKSGVSLRASASGYKTLREVLKL